MSRKEKHAGRYDWLQAESTIEMTTLPKLCAQMKNIYNITMYYFFETRSYYEAMDGFQLTMRSVCLELMAILLPLLSWDVE